MSNLSFAIGNIPLIRPLCFDLSDCDVGDAGGAVGVGAGEGEDFVELFAEGGGKGAVPYSVDEDEAAAAVLEVFAEELAEVVQLEVQGGPFGDTFAAGDALDVKVDGEVAGVVLEDGLFLGGFVATGRNGVAQAAVFLGIDGDEFAADGADAEAVELQFVVAFAEADDGSGVIGVHHPDLLAHGETFVLGMFLFRALELDGAFPRLILLRFWLRFGLKALLDDAEVFEVGEFHLRGFEVETSNLESRTQVFRRFL